MKTLVKKSLCHFGTAACLFISTFIWIVVGCANSNSHPLADQHGPEAVWNDMKASLEAGDVPGAVSCFSIASKNKYQQAFGSLSKAELVSFAKGFGPIKPSSIKDDEAQFYFENVVDGKTITFPIEFDMENGAWKIFEF